MLVTEIDPLQHREYGRGVDPQFPGRWSPRAMSGEALTEEEISALFEAARWAPSSYNSQPWRFLYAKRDTAHWQTFFDLLVEFNQSWAKDAAMLICIVSRQYHEGRDDVYVSASLDTGSAWMSLALQASRMGLVAHGMAGFDTDKAAKSLRLPPRHRVEAMAAIGRPGDTSRLPGQLAEREKPSPRKPLGEIALEGGFPG